MPNPSPRCNPGQDFVDLTPGERPGPIERKEVHSFLLGLAIILLSLAPALWAYRSNSAVLLGRYSVSYAALLAAHALLTLGALLASRYAAVRAALRLESLEGLATRALRGKILLFSALAILWAGLVAALFAVRDGYFGHSWTLHLCGTLTAFWGSLWILFAARKTRRKRTEAVTKFVMCLVSVIGLGTAFEVALRANPGLLSEALIQSLPEKGDVFFSYFQFDDEITVGYRYKPGVQFSQSMTESATREYDTYKGLVAPSVPGDDRVLSEASFRSDSIGYRNEEPLLDHYAIVVSGDSFTSHAVEPKPWPSLISERLHEPVLNLGLQGYGPQNEVEAIIRFGIPRNPRQIVIGYYEGNDILDAEGYERRKKLGKGWRDGARAKLPILDRQLSMHLIRHAAAQVFGSDEEPTESQPAGEFTYPFSVRLGTEEVSLGFADTYLSLLSLPRSDLERLCGFDAAMQAIDRLRKLCDEKGMRLLMAYFPTKEHCYLPLLPLELVKKKLGKALEPEISDEREFVMTRSNPRPLPASTLLQNLDCQRQLVLDTFKARGIQTLDLTPEFQAEAGKGAQLYWPLDNHWTPAGHELAARRISETLKAALGTR